MALSTLVALILASAAPTAAETRWRACIDKTTTNGDWAECGNRYVREADAALNAEWKRLMAVTEGQTKTDLIAEERAWIAYRKIACSFSANGDAGREGQVLHYFGCVAGVIEARTLELKAYRDFNSPQ